jgi:hypothetical protein
MNVPNIDRGAVSSAGTPRTDAGGEIPPPQPDAGPAPARAESPATSIALTRLAWFDANGDGRIDTRAAGTGGDATLLVPAHQVDLPTYRRVAHAAAGAHAAKPAESSGTDRSVRSTAENPAQTQRAVAAYQRYGDAAVPPTSVAALPSATANAMSASVRAVA